MITGLINDYSAVIVLEPRTSVVTLTPGEANVRVVEQIFPQESPEPPQRRGEIPARPSKRQIVTYFHDQKAWSEEALVAGQIAFNSPNASRPRGQLDAWGERVNIESPQHQAYGSMFAATQPVYGMG